MGSMKVWGGVGRGSRDGMDKCSFHVLHLNYIHKLTAGTTCDLYYMGSLASLANEPEKSQTQLLGVNGSFTVKVINLIPRCSAYRGIVGNFFLNC